MTDLMVGIGLVLVIEGVIYAAVPSAMKRMMTQLLDMPDQNLRFAGGVSVAVGVLIVWLVRGG